MEKIKWNVVGIFKADAEKCYNEIRALGDEVTPEQVVERAKDETSELHKCFEWNDSLAAESWRLHTARNITRSLVVVKVEEETERPSVRLFFKPQGSPTYKPTQLIVAKPDEYEALVRQAKLELEAYKKKYSIITNLKEIIAEVFAD